MLSRAFALGMVLLGLAPPVAAQTTDKVELVCNGTFSFYSSDTNRLQDIKSDGVFLKYSGPIVRIVGGAGMLNETNLLVTDENEAEIKFAEAPGVSGSLNRFTGRLIVMRTDTLTKKVDFIYEAACGRPKAIF